MGIRRAVLAAAVLAAVAAGAGCGRPGPAAVPRPAEPPPVLVSSAGLRLPLDGYQLTPVQLRTITNAYRALVGRCLVDLGFRRPAQTAAQPLAGPRTWTERRYGLTDAAAAATSGYHFPGQRPAADHPGSSGLGPAEQAVLTGAGPASVRGRAVPAGGCVGQAQRQLAMQPAGVDLQLAQRLSGTSFEQSRADPRVRAATTAWSQCMRSAGLSYATPLDAAGDPAFSRAVSARELATARQDVACKQRTNLVGIWFAAESGLQTGLLAANSAALGQARAANERTLRLASHVPLR